MVTVTSSPELVAVTPEPTKSNDDTDVVRLDPSSLTMMSPPAATRNVRITHLRYFPDIKKALAVTGTLLV
jgi:hypothetical protein